MPAPVFSSVATASFIGYSHYNAVGRRQDDAWHAAVKSSGNRHNAPYGGSSRPQHTAISGRNGSLGKPACGHFNSRSYANCGIRYAPADGKIPHRSRQNHHTRCHSHGAAAPHWHDCGTAAALFSTAVTGWHAIHGCLHGLPKPVGRRGLTVGKAFPKIFYPLLFHDTQIFSDGQTE